jgi:hypothetical protein
MMNSLVVESFCREPEESFLDHTVAAERVDSVVGFLSLLAGVIHAEALMALIFVTNEKNVYRHGKAPVRRR